MKESEINLKGFYLLNLGCAKNLVEGENLAGMMMQAGYEAMPEPDRARWLMVNTCGFIKPAVEEAVEAVFDLADAKNRGQKLVVIGCLVGRYGKKLERSLKEADIMIAPGETPNLVSILESGNKQRLHISQPINLFDSKTPRAISTGPGWAYLRIADGCNHRCAYCTIPGIRGKLRSRSIEDLAIEADYLFDLGVREFNLVAQDSTDYGRDLNNGSDLLGLVNRLAAGNVEKWIRILYMHPDTVDDLLIKQLLEVDSVAPYLDLPIQHIADNVLSFMERKKTGAQVREMVLKVRREHPEAYLRGTVMVGHPGEGKREFKELLEFIQEAGFDHLGCFAYQPESGTKSAYRERADAEVAEARRDEIMEAQGEISRARLESMVGRKERALILGPHPESELLWAARHVGQAPEVDGMVIITDGNGRPGEFADIRIEKAHEYDLEGVIL